MSSEPGGADAPPSAERGRLLLALARQAIGEALHVRLDAGSPRSASPPPAAAAISPADQAWLLAPGACFVTLTQQGRLRGCIGSVRARRPLGDDVRANARAAALSDPRFPPLAAHELAATRIEVSLLSPPSPVAARSEAEALAALRPGRDGVILEVGDRAQATFLPQVWEQLPEPRRFLAQLKHKAGLPAGYWSADIRLQRYSVVHWQEPA